MGRPLDFEGMWDMCFREPSAHLGELSGPQ